MEPQLDLVVVGSGIAGLTAALRAAEHGLMVGVVTKGTIDQAATSWAQGGVAVVLGLVPGDTVEQHRDDTLRAGAGLCDENAVRVLVEEGPARLRELIDLGAQFDRDPDGELHLAREGGHGHPRVVHAGGAATGAEIERALVEAVRRAAVRVQEFTFAEDLLVRDGRCRGVRVRDASGVRDVHADHVLLATGGAGQMFSLTTNPLEATGDGVAMALRAGVPVADVEFMQFHPTALAIDRLPRPLLSEALRGDGAVLRNAAGERFVDELQPRDIVSRAITAEMLKSGLDHAYLDVTPIEGFARQFPTLAAVLEQEGLDPARDWLPVAPAAHYLCGGIVVDIDGASALPHLWAAGEVACSGVHGANRLASNSLLDGLVFGARVVDAIAKGRHEAEPTGVMRCLLDPAVALPCRRAVLPPAPRDARPIEPDELRRAMTFGAGVLRDASSLASAADAAAAARTSDDPELRNVATVAAALTTAAIERQESRGAHTRVDHPERDDTHWRCRIVLG
ncbi:MAG TPA: L-aspartate oxidase [Acidimicrobiales bacterium]